MVKIFNGVFENDCFKIVCALCVVGRNLTLQNFIVTTRIRQQSVVLQVNQSNINKDTKGNGKEAVRKLN